MLTPETERDIGRLEGRVGAVEKTVDEIKDDVKQILAVVNQTKGGWKTLSIVGAISGSVGALLVKLLPFTSGLPK